MKSKLGLVLLLLLPSAKAILAQQYQYPFQNPDLPIEQRIDILSRMTLEDKVSALSTNPRVPRLGILGASHIEGLHGVALGRA
jgi:beta-glucosidase